MLGHELYRRLQEPTSIRLFQLVPGVQDDAFQGRLLDANVEDGQPYEALSYVWGSEDDKVNLDCNTSQLRITQNLAGALLRLRRQEASRLLWIDSICINQDDVHEKNHQVRIMTQIYRNASRVLIYLGEKSETIGDTAKAFECMNLLVEKLAPRLNEIRGWHCKTTIKANETLDSEMNVRFGIPRVDSQEFVALGRLFSRPWFRRAWTFQESFVARDKQFHCGAYAISGDHIMTVVSVLWELYNATKNVRYLEMDLFYLNAMLASERSREGEKSLKAGNFRSTLSVLLNQRRGAGCKDPRDLVYSVLGVAVDGIPITPDYNQSFEYVFAYTVAQVISMTGSLKVFGQIDSDTGQSTLPTWVPDWRLGPDSKRGYDCYLSLTAIDEHRYSCTGSSKALAELSPCGKEITLQGIDRDTIKKIMSVDAYDTYNEIEALYWSVYAPTDEPLSLAFEKLICADYPRWDPTYHPAIGGRIKDSDVESRVAEETIRKMWGKSVATTQKKALALVPEWAQIGDSICWLLGGEVPILLRQDPVDGKYTMVGECYVHGFMDGEVLMEAREEVEPDYGRTDSESWLYRLHTEPLPFRPTRFTIK
ncbi:MAG: hypothetical protein L6R37_007970 [Teloschistes peruensis]|nr:MAG: hypothetical protein L6R37_007970 [Teloschistes peruensis]